MSLKNHLIKQTIWTYILSYIAIPFGLFIKILYSKNLSIEEFGIFYMVLGFYILISIFNDLGFSETLNYYGVRFYEKKDYRSLKLSYYYALIMQFTTTVIISLIMIIFSELISVWWFNSEQASNIIKILTIYYICMNTLRPMLSLYLVKLDIFWNKIYNIFYLSGIFITSYIFFKYDNSIISVGVSWSLVYLILCIMYYFLIKYQFKNEFKDIKFKLDFKLYKKLWSYALPVMIGSGASLLLRRIDVQMIGFMTNVTNVSFYEIGLSISSMLTLIIGPVIGIIFPITSKLIENNKFKELEKMITFIYEFFLILLVPLFILFSVFSKEIISLIFKNEFFHSSILIIILNLTSILTLYYTLNFSILSGLGKVKERNKILYFGGTVNIILNLILLHFIGLIGAAIATTIVSLFLFISSYLLIKKEKINLNIKISKIIKIIFSSIIFYITIIILKKIIILNILIKGPIIISISGLVYLICCWNLKLFRIKKIIKLINVKIPNKLLFLNKY